MRFAFIILFVAAFVAAPEPSFAQGADTFALAEVIQITEEREEDIAGFDRTVQTAVLKVTSGYETGKTFTLENGVIAGRSDMLLAVGETVIVEKIERIDGSESYAIRDKYRLWPLALLTLFFVALTILFGGRVGVRAFIGLIVSVLLLTLLIVPAIVRGGDPLTTSLLGAFAIACTSIYLAHGFSRRTSVALVSTLITLTLAALLAIVFVHMAKLFGLGSEEALFLQSGPLENVNLRGLLLGGIIIGALGVLDDITTAQTAAVHELSRANPSLTQRELRTAGMSIGREHIASLINTLALAYVGSSLPLLLLFTMNVNFPLWVTLNSEFMAEEIIRTLIGSAALLLAVPISTSLAARFMRGAPEQSGHAHVHMH